MTDREFGGAWIAYWNSCIVSKALPRPNGEFQAGLQIKEGNSPMVELFANDALRRQAETIAVEMYRPFQVVSAEGNNCNAWLHGKHLSPVDDLMAWLIEVQPRIAASCAASTSASYLGATKKTMY
jgi:hypothetical protein